MNVRPSRNLRWVKSSYSEGSGDCCVGVAVGTSRIFLRDSKDVSIPGIQTSVASWSAFLSHATR
ncbi:DUF397 domain-containing protein [Streptomyces sp. NPDC059783]|uniref:DUF397 domain-containing protein n=1 Tax=Streptomyces sp. NPDC059783 TaxID=3346944 RepID=UPI003664F3EF